MQATGLFLRLSGCSEKRKENREEYTSVVRIRDGGIAQSDQHARAKLRNGRILSGGGSPPSAAQVWGMMEKKAITSRDSNSGFDQGC